MSELLVALLPFFKNEYIIRRFFFCTLIFFSKNWEKAGEQMRERLVQIGSQHRGSFETLNNDTRANPKAVICTKNALKLMEFLSLQ